jgi:hypothetical protein
MRNTDAGVRVGWAVIPARAASIALLWLLTGLFAFAAEAVELPPFGSQEYLILGIVLLLAFAALGFGFYLLRWTLGARSWHAQDARGRPRDSGRRKRLPQTTD